MAGRRYYIDASGSEAYYFDKMMSEIRFLTDYPDPELEPYRPGPFDGCRVYTERFFPAIARKEGLKEGWDYRDLYLLILEKLAGKLRISRFKVYTVEELLLKIRQKAGILSR